MFGAAKTASDVQTDEDCEELVDESFSFSADFLEKTPRRKKSSGKPPPSPKSPYLTSMDLNPRRSSAWRRARASLGDTRGGTPGDRGSARLTSPSNGLGVTFSSGELREKEDMYDEIIRLKKSLQAQRSDNQQLKARLQRLEEDHARREKQIQELLDPSKQGSEYTRSLVDKKKEGGVVVNGLKQRILKLEQQCREKENALSKLQSQLRTTSLEELTITVDTYCEEILRLKMLLAAAEKSGRAESKCSQRQQKALNVTVHRLTENLKQLQQENMELKDELDTESPAGLRGYRDWSRQRLLRRLLELEQLTPASSNQRPQDGRGHAHSAQSSGRQDREVQATPTDILSVTVATEAVVSVGTVTEGGEELPDLRERLSQLEEERAELQELLLSREEELKQLKTERQEETERWTTDRDRERQEHSLEVDQLVMKIQALEAKAEQPSVSGPSPEDEGDSEEEEEEEGDEGDEGQKRRQEAVLVIQSSWRQHRKQDTIQLQSALRAHLVRVLHLRDQQRATDSQAEEVKDGSHVESSQWDVTLIQSVLRGHLTRCGVSVDSSRVWSVVPSRVYPTFPRTGDEEQRHEGDPCLTSRPTPPTGSAPASVDSDDSDDIIMSPSHPLRTRKVLMM